MDKYKENVIIGGGVSGLTTAFYINNSIIIDKNPLGQLNYPISLGPRLINVDKFSEEFCKNFCDFFSLKIIKKDAKIGYEINNEILEELHKEFIEKYVSITRNKKYTDSEKNRSYLSNQKNIITYFTFRYFDEFSQSNTYKFIFEKIFVNLVEQNRIIFNNVKSICAEEKKIVLDNNDQIYYNNLISTIRTDRLISLIVDETPEIAKIKNYEFILLPKSFYKCEYSEKQIENSKKFNYIYSVDGEFTRKTFFNDHIIYETISAVKSDTIDGCKILNRFENILLQIKDNFYLDKIHDIFLIGRFAEWNHNIKLNENIKRSLEINSIIING